jgi:hypothetical protein
MFKTCRPAVTMTPHRSNSTLSPNENMVNSVKQKIADVVGSSRAGADKQDGGNVTERIVDVDIPTYAIDGYSDKLKRSVMNAVQSVLI